MSGLRIAVVGATGAVGREMWKLLEASRIPVATIHAYSSARSAGTSLMFRGAAVTCRELCDATFTPAEYATRQGWGHSTWLDGVKLARRAGVADLLLSHLNPDHTDTQVDEWARQAKREFRGARPAREGLRLSTGKA